MTKAGKGLTVLAVPFVLGFLLGFIVRGGCKGKEDCSKQKTEITNPGEYLPDSDLVGEEPQAEDSCVVEDNVREIFYYTRKISYGKTFADLNELHLRAADSLGLINIPQDRLSVKAIAGLDEIETCDLFVVDTLKYSMPYLTKGGIRELKNIARAFRDSLKNKELLPYKPIVTSVLRTEEDVNHLRKSGNPNASDNSAHCYGTTFDISWSRYWIEDESEVMMRPYELTKVLAEVLRDERSAGRCLVKYERKECCFHITSLLP